MSAVLTWLMTGQAPEARSGDATERRSAYVNFLDVVEAIRLANEPQTQAIERLERTFSRELQIQTTALTSRLDGIEGRLGAVETWKELQEDAALVRQGKLAVTLGAIRLLGSNAKVVWALVVFILGMFAMLTGHAPLGVGPIDAQP